MKQLKQQKGFTLIEVLIVVAILGVLAAAIIPNLSSMLGSADLASANTEADIMRTAILAYHTDTRDWPDGDYDKDSNGVLAKYIEKSLTGSYSVSTSGNLIGTGGWNGLEWEDGQWIKATD